MTATSGRRLESNGGHAGDGKGQPAEANAPMTTFTTILWKGHDSLDTTGSSGLLTVVEVDGQPEHDQGECQQVRPQHAPASPTPFTTTDMVQEPGQRQGMHEGRGGTVGVLRSREPQQRVRGAKEGEGGSVGIDKLGGHVWCLTFGRGRAWGS